MKIIIEIVGCTLDDDLVVKIPCQDCESVQSCKAIHVIAMVREIRDLLAMPKEKLEKLAKASAFKVLTENGGDMYED